MHAGRLLQFGNDRALFSVHKRFSVGAIALIEPDCPGGVFVQDFFPVWSGRFQVAVLKEHHNDVFVMEMHRRGHARCPCGIPHNHAIIFKKLFGVGPWKSEWVTALVFYRNDPSSRSQMSGP